MRSWQDADTQTSHSPNRARIFGVSYIVEPLRSTSREAEAIHIGRRAPTTRNFNPVPCGVEFTPPRFRVSDLGVIVISRFPVALSLLCPGLERVT